MTLSHDENFNIKHYLKNNKICHFEIIDFIVSCCNNIEDALESVKHRMCNYEINYPYSKQNGIEYPRCAQALGSLKHVLEYSHTLEQDTLESLKHQICSYETKLEFLDDSICVKQEALENLNDPICNNETNDCSLKHGLVEDLPCVPQEALENLNDPICNNENETNDCSLKHGFVEDLPCVPQDALESLNDPICSNNETNDCSLKHGFVEDFPQDALESLNDPICNNETNDSSSKHEFVEDLPCVPQDAQESLIHQIFNGESIARYEFLNDPLCIPQDPIESLEFVDFWGLDSLISVGSLFSNDLETPHKEKNNNLERLENDNTRKRPLDELSNVEINYPRKSRTKKGRNNICARTRSSNYKKNKDDLENLVPNWNDFMKKERRCIHCDAKETPQWRAGPLGRNTLCNACGIRYKKTGKLLPEYRPAASPTFDVIKHSNIHKKILKLRAYRSI